MSERQPSGRRVLATRILSFGSLPILASLSPLLVLPAVARASSPDVWAAFVAAQTIGSFAGTLIMFGWNLTGQARIALARALPDRSEVYGESLRSRGILFGLAAPAAALAAVLISPPDGRVAVVMMAIAMSYYGLSMSWYAVGTGRARSIALYEALPRLVAALASSVLVWLTGEVWIYPLILICLSVGGTIAFNRATFGVILPAPPRGVRVLASLRESSHTAFATVVGGAYASAPLPITVAAGGALAGGMASVDRLYRYGLLAMSALSSATHAWSLQLSGPALRRRQYVTLALHALVAGVGGLAIALAGPWATAWLFGAELAGSAGLCGLYGAAFAMVTVSTPLIRNLLIPFGRSRTVATATVIGIAVGLPSMLVGVQTLGAVGVAGALALTELICLLVILPPSLRLLLMRSRAEGDRTNESRSSLDEDHSGGEPQ